MAFGVEDFQTLTDLIALFWGVLYAVIDPIIIRFLELIVSYLTGELIDNVIFMSFFFIILGTALILVFKFMK